MAKKIKPSVQIKAAHDIGALEARVSTGEPTLKAKDFIQYLINCEIADMRADNRVLKYILDKNFITQSRKLKRQYTNYKSKYWK